MNNTTQQIVNEAWNFAHMLRDDGLLYMAYTEQFTFLLFLKMADARTRAPYNRPPIVPLKLGWASLLAQGINPSMSTETQALSRPRHTMTIEKDVKVRMRDGVGAAPYLHYPAAYNTDGENTVHTGGRMASYLLLPVIPPKS